MRAEDRFHMRNAVLSCAAILVAGQVAFLAQAASGQSWQALDSRVAELYARGDLAQAIETARAALGVAASPRESGRSLDRLGFLYYTSGNLAEGEKYLRESLHTRQSAFGADSLEYAETANDLAMLLRDLRRMDEAREIAEHAVATRRRVLGDDRLPVAESLNTLGTVVALSGDYGNAVSRFEQALAIHELRPSPERATEEYGTLCINLAGTYQRLGKYESAESTFRKGLDALRVKPGVEHPAYAASLVAYAAFEVDLGRYVDAERLYDEGGRLVRNELGDRHPIYATFLNNRGFFYQSIGNVAAADADYQRSLDLKRSLYGAGSPLAISTLRNLAHLTYSRDHREGERLLAEAVEAYARLTSAPPFDFTSVLVGLARAQRDRGALAEARTTATRALDVSRAGLGERHPLFASAMRELGLALAAAHEDEDAERQLRHALAIAEDVHGSRHPDVATFLDALGDFYVERQKPAAALGLYARSLEIQDRFARDVLEIGSESFKTASLATAPDPIPRLLTFQSVATDLPGARALAFEAVASRKGRVVEQVRYWRQRLHESASESIRQEARDWQAMLECRTSLTVALGYRDLRPSLAGTCSLKGTDLEGRYERLLSDLRSRWTADVGAQAVQAIGVLQERADRLEASLNREAGGAGVDTTPAHVEDLRRQLNADEALVEFVSYADGPSRSDGSTPRRYGAFVLDGVGTLNWADLGPAAPIDAAVADLLQAAHDWSVSVGGAERAAAAASARTAREVMADLSVHVWRPVKALLDAQPNLRRLRIAPDGSLNLVPFEALSDGHELIDRFAITYLPAGRDVMARSSSAPASAPVVVVSPGARSRRSQAIDGAAFRADGLSRLAAAAGEAADVREIVSGTIVLTAAGATEQHVKRLRGPVLLHIVGHGVVRDKEDCGGRPCAAASLDPMTRAMSLAAIVLEEAYGRGAGSSDDGLLTALELQNMDLRGTEMLVLSQCQMASGAPSVGEGVYGMRRAALIAGAQTFVAPLWNVDDDVQRRLMKQFYGGLAAGESRADALRQAKLSLRRSRATSSFLYWAPVILSGSSDPLPRTLFHRPQKRSSRRHVASFRDTR